MRVEVATENIGIIEPGSWDVDGVWTAEELLEANDQDGEVAAALESLLDHEVREVHLGGGAAPSVRLRRVE